jgi:gluconate 2-dehydrogenase alpha chain
MGRAACTYCGFCRNNGCHVEAKGSPDVSLLPVVEATGRLRIETGARVIRIETDRDGLAAGVVYLQAGRELLQPARAVVLSSFLYENVRLLLLSRSEAHPRGLANGHGQVGKHYMAHVTPFVFGLYPGRKLNRWNGSGGQIVCVDDWNGDVFDHQGLGFVGGGMLMSMGEVRPIGAVTDPLPPSIPRWGSAWKAWLKQNAQSVGAAFAQFEPLSYEGNELDLDPVGRDSVGLPVVRVTHRIHENERRGCAFLREKLRSWLEAAGAGETWASHEIALDPRHPYGGTRLGTDPASSVVDAHGFAHEAPNLCVVGASTFATAGGHNPTLTLQALAWRSAQHLVDDWDAHHR